MLKNWIVKTQTKHKVIGHLKYLMNNNAKSHQTTRIVVLRNNAKSIINAKEKRTEYRKDKGLKGGYVKSEATSFILSIPRDITQLTDAQWKKLSNHVLKQLHAHINKKVILLNIKNEKFNLKHPTKKQPLVNQITIEDFAKHCHVVLHDETAAVDKNSHLHIIVSNIINNDFIKPVTQLGATYNIKQSFNFAMKKLVNEDHMQYTPKSSVFQDEDKDFTEKKKIMERPTNYRFSSTFKLIFIRLQENFNHWLQAVFNKETLKIKDYAEKAASDIKILKNNKTDEINIILETAHTVEKANALSDKLKITSKVKKRLPRRRKKSNTSSPKNK
jgi:hypothetical protein